MSFSEYILCDVIKKLYFFALQRSGAFAFFSVVATPAVYSNTFEYGMNH